MQQHFDIPDNIARYVDMYDGVKLNIQVSTRVLSSYIRQQTYTVLRHLCDPGERHASAVWD